MTSDKARVKALTVFVAGYLHGRSSLGNHEAAGREAQEAFYKWWNETRVGKIDDEEQS